MTGIYIFHEPSDKNQQSTKNDTTLTGYAFLDVFFIRAMSMARYGEEELELNICLPDPLPIGETDMEYLPEAMCKVIADVEITGEFMAGFVRRACQAGGTADLSLDGEVQTLWASFPLLEHARCPALHRVLE